MKTNKASVVLEICISRCEKCGLEHKGNSPHVGDCPRCGSSLHIDRWITPPLLPAVGWQEALKMSATDNDRVTLTAARIESAAIAMREANPKNRAEIISAEVALLKTVRKTIGCEFRQEVFAGKTC